MSVEVCPCCNRPLDLTVICRSCGRTFSVSAREQQFFQARGLANPKNCSHCRRERRLRNVNPGSTPEPNGETNHADPVPQS